MRKVWSQSGKWTEASNFEQESGKVKAGRVFRRSLTSLCDHQDKVEIKMLCIM